MAAYWLLKSKLRSQLGIEDNNKMKFSSEHNKNFEKENNSQFWVIVH